MSFKGKQPKQKKHEEVFLEDLEKLGLPGDDEGLRANIDKVVAALGSQSVRRVTTQGTLGESFGDDFREALEGILAQLSKPQAPMPALEFEDVSGVAGVRGAQEEAEEDAEEDAAEHSHVRRRRVEMVSHRGRGEEKQDDSIQGVARLIAFAKYTAIFMTSFSNQVVTVIQQSGKHTPAGESKEDASVALMVRDLDVPEDSGSAQAVEEWTRKLTTVGSDLAAILKQHAADDSAAGVIGVLNEKQDFHTKLQAVVPALEAIQADPAQLQGYSIVKNLELPAVMKHLEKLAAPEHQVAHVDSEEEEEAEDDVAAIGDGHEAGSARSPLLATGAQRKDSSQPGTEALSTEEAKRRVTLLLNIIADLYKLRLVFLAANYPRLSEGATAFYESRAHKGSPPKQQDPLPPPAGHDDGRGGHLASHLRGLASPPKYIRASRAGLVFGHYDFFVRRDNYNPGCGGTSAFIWHNIRNLFVFGAAVAAFADVAVVGYGVYTTEIAMTAKAIGTALIAGGALHFALLAGATAAAAYVVAQLMDAINVNCINPPASSHRMAMV